MQMVIQIKNTHLSLCLDFAEELSELETMAKDMGVTVMTATKYHAEYMGKGIEYVWGVAKSDYKKIKLEDLKEKDNLFEMELKVRC